MINVTSIEEIEPSVAQRLSVAALAGHCESIISSGRLAEPTELSLRLLVNEALTAFGMPTKAERSIRVGDHTPEPTR